MESDISQVLNNNGPMHHDFVPHIARISNLMKMTFVPYQSGSKSIDHALIFVQPIQSRSLKRAATFNSTLTVIRKMINILI